MGTSTLTIAHNGNNDDDNSQHLSTIYNVSYCSESFTISILILTANI